MNPTLHRVAHWARSLVLITKAASLAAAAVLGVVGAGGLGQMLSWHLGLFKMHESCTVLLATMSLVAVVDAMS